MKIRVAFLLALALLSFGASMLVGLNVTMPKLCSVPCSVAGQIGFTVQPCGDPVDGTPSFPH